MHYCVTISPHHHITASLCEIFATTFTMLPHHHITALVSHLTCPVPPHQSVIHVIALVSHLTCPRPPHQSVILHPAWDFPHLLYCITTLLHYCITMSPHHHITASPHEIFPTTFTMSPHHHITALVSHLTCPVPPHQSVILCHCIRFFPPPLPCYCITVLQCHHITASPHHCIAMLPHHHVTTSLHYCTTMSLHHHITMSLHYCVTAWDFPHHLYCITTLVSHLTCPLPPHQSVIPHHHISQSLDLPSATTPVSYTTSLHEIFSTSFTTSLCYHITASLHYCVTVSLCEIFPTIFTASPHHRITASLSEIFQTTFTASPHYHVTALPCYCITTWDFSHHIGMNLIG